VAVGGRRRGAAETKLMHGCAEADGFRLYRLANGYSLRRLRNRSLQFNKMSLLV
jgi:hypothetical protein